MQHICKPIEHTSIRGSSSSDQLPVAGVQMNTFTFSTLSMKHTCCLLLRLKQSIALHCVLPVLALIEAPVVYQ
jgi:hypothetical protein